MATLSWIPWKCSECSYWIFSTSWNYGRSISFSPNLVVKLASKRAYPRLLQSEFYVGLDITCWQHLTFGTTYFASFDFNAFIVYVLDNRPYFIRFCMATDGYRCYKLKQWRTMVKEMQMSVSIQSVSELLSIVYRFYDMLAQYPRLSPPTRNQYSSQTQSQLLVIPCPPPFRGTINELHDQHLHEVDLKFEQTS